MEISFDLTMAWAVLIATSVFIYVALDGFDLGVGILYPLFPEKRDRDLMMNALAPVWDGNETWLILGGGGLFAAFPLAYAILMPAVYLPLLVMLLALIFRGVAFEFRWRASNAFWLRFWDMAFFGGSTLAAFSQGVILGAILQGIEVEGRAFAGGAFDWLSGFSVMTGLAVVCGYTLLGTGWLILKTEGPVHDACRRLARPLLLGMLAFIAFVSAATPFLEGQYFDRWFEWPGVIGAALAPILVAALAWALWRALESGRDGWPFLLMLGLFLVTYAGLGLSVWPYVIPTEITIWQAATPFVSQIFMFVGAVVLIPIILVYTGYAYWVFRGKLDPDAGYHS